VRSPVSGADLHKHTGHLIAIEGILAQLLWADPEDNGLLLRVRTAERGREYLVRAASDRPEPILSDDVTDRWDNEPPRPTLAELKPTHGQPHDSESLDGCEGIGWNLSWGFRLNVGHDTADDPTSPLTIGACFSDSDQARGIVVRETTPEQLEEFARLLLDTAAKHRLRMTTRPKSSGDHNCTPECPTSCPQDDDDPRGWQG
jgi:hypothetical protein